MYQRSTKPVFYDLTQDSGDDLPESQDALRHAIEDLTMAIIGLSLRGGMPCR